MLEIFLPTQVGNGKFIHLLPADACSTDNVKALLGVVLQVAKAGVCAPYLLSRCQPLPGAGRDAETEVKCKSNRRIRPLSLFLLPISVIKVWPGDLTVCLDALSQESLSVGRCPLVHFAVCANCAGPRSVVAL